MQTIDITAAEIIDAGRDHGSTWWQLAEWLKNGWIAPGEEVAVVLGAGGSFGPLSSFASDKTPEQQVRANLAYYADGYVVTRLGARRVTA